MVRACASPLPWIRFTGAARPAGAPGWRVRIRPAAVRCSISTRSAAWRFENGAATAATGDGNIMSINIEQLRAAQTEGAGTDRAHWDEWLQFSLGQQQYGLNVLQIREIICATEITPVPGAPRHVLGIINVRGSIITVVDTRQRLALPLREMRDSDWILVMDVDGQSIGLLVDEVSEVIDVDPRRIESMHTNDS